MQTVFIQYVYLILIIIALVMVANKLKLTHITVADPHGETNQ